MPIDPKTALKPPPQTHLATTFQTHQPRRRRVFFLRRRNNKLPTIRLGDKKKPRRGLLIVSVLKKLKWMKLQYTCMLRKLKKHYRNLIKDLIESSANVEAFQQRMFMESTFAVPVMGISFSSFPPGSASDRPKSLLF